MSKKDPIHKWFFAEHDAGPSKLTDDMIFRRHKHPEEIQKFTEEAKKSKDTRSIWRKEISKRKKKGQSKEDKKQKVKTPIKYKKADEESLLTVENSTKPTHKRGWRRSQRSALHVLSSDSIGQVA